MRFQSFRNDDLRPRFQSYVCGSDNEESRDLNVFQRSELKEVNRAAISGGEDPMKEFKANHA